VEPHSAPASDAATEAPAIPRQRWRLVLARDAGAPGLAGRELIDAWEAALESSGLPGCHPVGRTRARVAFGAPLPVGIALEHELADIVLTESLPRWQVREALGDRLPEGWRLLDVHDVWLGAPALAGQVAAADYRIDVGVADARAVAAAAEALLAARRLPRERVKGGTVVRYDLRPLLVDVAVIDAGPPVVVRTRTRFDPVLGTGRPEEVVAALGAEAGATLEVRSLVRERLILADRSEVDGEPEK
jgi:radical SAM-linked protein